MIRTGLIFLLSLFISLQSFALTVRVKERRGSPQIHVDGKPIPPRFFWGSMNSGHIGAKTEWTTHSFEFLPGDVKGTGTLHFRFSQVPGDIWLADVRIQDTKTGEDILTSGSFATAEGFKKTWSQWPTGDANTVGKVDVTGGTVHVTLKKPANGAWPDFHLHSNTALSFVAGQTYRCSFRAKATPVQDLRVSLYSVAGGTWNFIGGPPGAFLNQVALARDAGVNLVSFSAPNCWTSPEKPIDWTSLDSLCRKIIEVNPKVLLVPRVGADAPDWWLKQHPESRMVYDGNKVVNHSCVSDRTYRIDVCAHLERLCRHLTEAFPDHFAGIHPCGQNTGEWFYQDSWRRPVSGYDPATKNAFRQWLKTRGDSQADTAEPPTADERRAHPNGLLRDPAREARLIDFARFQQQEMAEHVMAMAAACRKGTDGQKLVVFFYGYLFEFAPLQCGAPISGHYALSSVLKSRDIDILCSPISYTDREWLGTAPSMTAAESVRLAGILWLNEDDSRTYLDPRKQEHVQEGGLVNLEQTQQVMLRNTAQAALRGFGTWWMDLPAQGWFNDAHIWEEIIRLHDVDAAMAKRRRPFTPDIAAIIGEDSMCHLPGGSAVFARPLIYEGRAALGRSGAPYGQYLLDDVIAGKVPARLQVFLSAWALTPDERAALISKRSRNTTCVWCYAPGYLYPDRADVAGIKEVTGFEARMVTPATTEVMPTGFGRKLGLVTPWGPKESIQPLFSVAATPDDTLATYCDGSPAVALRRSDKGLDVFVGVPRLTPELVRALAKLAGVHLFTDGKATVWATDKYLSLQVHEEGPLVIDTGRKGKIVDALDGQPVGSGPKLTLMFKQGETRVLKY
ncbi:MAG: beta-galactosidase [Kiritimatiellae bacterium]|nr:beta-galactosidase [Kiritimatiellia bacterium]MDD5520483.1 beta-galactosidase [Kiritimatiellia bacterium]